MTSPRLLDSRDIVRRIAAFNSGRDPKGLERKYRAMRGSPFTFFRGTAHLFWEDWAASESVVADAPPVWACGDLHLENFGTFRGDNDLVYFDQNDFDEAARAPATADLVRLLTSLHLAGRSIGADDADATALGTHLADAYAEALVDGKARWVERAIAKGMVRELLLNAQERSRRELLETRTTRKRRKRRLVLDGRRTVALPAREHTLVAESIRDAAESFERHPYESGFFEVLDVAARLAGVGSLGVRRYVVLVRGHGGAHGNCLLDVKQVGRSSLAAHIPLEQPRWRNEAERVVNIQRRIQAISPALLTAVSFDGAHFVLRELQPVEDRLALGLWDGKLARLRKVVVTMGHVLAWAQLRCASRQGAAGIDELIAFGRAKAWRRPAFDYARAYAATAEADWTEFGGVPSKPK